MNLIALPAFTDNCIWMRHDGRQAVVVDPADESAPVIAALDAQQLVLAAILVTRHRAAPVGRARRINPFLRRDEPAGAHGTRSDRPVAVLAALRPWKNNSR